MKIVKHLLILTLGLSFVACSGKSDNKDENNGKIIEKPESACDCIKNTVVVAEDLIDDLEKKDDLSRSEFDRIIKDWREKNEDSKWNRICEKEYKDVRIENIKNCEASKQYERIQSKLKEIERRFSGKDEPKREEYKGEGGAYDGSEYDGSEYDGSEYDGSEYEGSEYEGPEDAPDDYDEE